jgi:hypothetical protein
MKKILSLFSALFLLSGCVESMALLGPASTIVGGGNIARSSVSTALNYGLKKQTGSTASEHALNYIKEYNPENKKEKCLSFVNAKTEVCAAVKKNIALTKKKIKENSKIQFLNSNK